MYRRRSPGVPARRPARRHRCLGERSGGRPRAPGAGPSRLRRPGNGRWPSGWLRPWLPTIGRDCRGDRHGVGGADVVRRRVRLVSAGAASVGRRDFLPPSERDVARTPRWSGWRRRSWRDEMGDPAGVHVDRAACPRLVRRFRDLTPCSCSSTTRTRCRVTPLRSTCAASSCLTTRGTARARRCCAGSSSTTRCCGTSPHRPFRASRPRRWVLAQGDQQAHATTDSGRHRAGPPSGGHIVRRRSWISGRSRSPGGPLGCPRGGRTDRRGSGDGVDALASAPDRPGQTSRAGRAGPTDRSCRCRRRPRRRGRSPHRRPRPESPPRWSAGWSLRRGGDAERGDRECWMTSSRLTFPPAWWWCPRRRLRPRSAPCGRRPTPSRCPGRRPSPSAHAPWGPSPWSPPPAPRRA